MWNNIKIVGRWFWKVIKINIAFRWFSAILKFLFFDRRFADWPWNIVILLTFQVPVHFFDEIFGICDTCRCEMTLNLFADDSGTSQNPGLFFFVLNSSLLFAFSPEKHCVWFAPCVAANSARMMRVISALTLTL